MKNLLSIFGAVLFVAGFALATGVDQNPVQAIYACLLLIGACVCFRAADATRSEKRKVKSEKLSGVRYREAA